MRTFKIVLLSIIGAIVLMFTLTSIFVSSFDGKVETQANDTVLKTEENNEISEMEGYFTEAMESYNNGDYLLAKIRFEKIKPIVGEQYDKAQEKIKEILPYLAKEELENAKKFFSESKYIEAYTSLQKSIEYDANLEDAKKLLDEYESKKIEAEKAQEIANMKLIEKGKGPVAIGVDVKIQETFNDGYTIHSSKDGKSQFVLVFVEAHNTGTDKVHVNPTYLTLSTPDGMTVNPDKLTYSLDNHLEAIDIQKDSYTSGWVIFFAPKTEYYKLNYSSLDSEITKKIVY
jgi:uncharacterized protein DUF4352